MNRQAIKITTFRQKIPLKVFGLVKKWLIVDSVPAKASSYIAPQGFNTENMSNMDDQTHQRFLIKNKHDISNKLVNGDNLGHNYSAQFDVLNTKLNSSYQNDHIHSDSIVNHFAAFSDSKLNYPTDTIYPAEFLKDMNISLSQYRDFGSNKQDDSLASIAHEEIKRHEKSILTYL